MDKNIKKRKISDAEKNVSSSQKKKKHNVKQSFKSEECLCEKKMMEKMEKKCPVCTKSFIGKQKIPCPIRMHNFTICGIPLETCPTCQENNFKYISGTGGAPHIYDILNNIEYFKDDDQKRLVFCTKTKKNISLQDILNRTFVTNDFVNKSQNQQFEQSSISKERSSMGQRPLPTYVCQICSNGITKRIFNPQVSTNVQKKTVIIKLDGKNDTTMYKEIYADENNLKINAKDELISELLAHDRETRSGMYSMPEVVMKNTIVAAEIFVLFDRGQKIHTISLQKEYSPEQLDTFAQALDFFYDAGIRGDRQQIHGIVWLSENTWLQRTGEYWSRKTVPKIFPYLSGNSTRSVENTIERKSIENDIYDVMFED